jgi:hypothetical protein
MAQYRGIDSGGGPQWNSKLLKELFFIKKNLRYPYGRVLVVSFIVFALVAAGVVFKLMTTPVVNYLPVIVVMVVIGVIMSIPALQYVAALKFKAINTRYTEAGNTELLNEFFAAQNLSVFRHPEAEGIFQLQSRPIVYRRSSTWEIITFIVDDRRILINTHYSDFNFGRSRAARDLENRLRHWVNSGGYVSLD